MHVGLLIVVLAVGVLAGSDPRVFVSDSQSWEAMGGFSRLGGGIRAGARPQTAETIKTLRAQCRGIIVTIDRERADYILLLEHDGGKGHARKDNKWVLFTQDGDALGSGSTRTLGNATKNACDALAAHWNPR